MPNDLIHWLNCSFRLCIFCGETDESFTDEGLDLHYWTHCPMLRHCDECKQVDLTSWLSPQRPNTAGKQLLFVFTGGWDSECYGTPAEWMWKQVQVQAVHALLRGRARRRPAQTRPGSHLQPWVLGPWFCPTKHQVICVLYVTIRYRAQGHFCLPSEALPCFVPTRNQTSNPLLASPVPYRLGSSSEQYG